MQKFKDLGLTDTTILPLKKKGFEEPTDIQTLAIPLVLEGKTDIIAQAQTGTGKTAAFSLPLFEKLDPNKKSIQAIILAPTRELVIQICEEMNSMKSDRKISVAPIYGGQSMPMQLKKLRQGVSIIVGTPGRILDHIKRRSLKLENISHFILDEADEMLNMGFIEDIESILSETPKEKRVLLFSATMPDRIKKLGKRYMVDPQHIKTKAKLTTNLTDQIYFEVNARDKFEALCRIIDMESEFYGIVFCRTKVDVDTTVSHLIDRGYMADALHGDIAQAQREKILMKFRNKKLTVLVATDVAARGISVDNLTHVINFSLPQNSETYVHRIGRTGRAGNQGTAITFVTRSEFRQFSGFERATKSTIRKEQVPKVKEILKARQDAITQEITSDQSPSETSQLWAQELLDNPDKTPQEILANLLQYTFGKKLDESNYKELSPARSGKRDRNDRGGRSDRRDRRDRGGRSDKRDRGARSDRRERGERSDRRDRRSKHGKSLVEEEGKTRLFIAQGSDNSFNKPKLVDYLVKEAGTPSHLIQNVNVNKGFSFVTVPFAEAEQIIKVFKKKAGNKRTEVEKAKAPK